MQDVNILQFEKKMLTTAKTLKSMLLMLHSKNKKKQKLVVQPQLSKKCGCWCKQKFYGIEFPAYTYISADDQAMSANSERGLQKILNETNRVAKE